MKLTLTRKRWTGLKEQVEIRFFSRRRPSSAVSFSTAESERRRLPCGTRGAPQVGNWRKNACTSLNSSWLEEKRRNCRKAFVGSLRN